MSTEPEPNFGTRLGRALTWVLLTIIRLVATLLLLLALAFLIQFGLRLLTQSIDRVASRVDLLDGDVARLMETTTSQAGDLLALRSDLDAQAEMVNALSDDLGAQGETLSMLEELAAQLAGGHEELVEGQSAQGAALAALQGDVVSNSGQIDELGGLVDGLQQGLVDQVNQVDGRLAALEEVGGTPQEELARLQQAVRLFRLWELVARAKLRLSENNPGLAALDAQMAAAGADLLSETETTLDVTPLQLRLFLALENLPGDPAAAARDLEIAWEVIDQLLAELLAPGLEAPESPGGLTAGPTGIITGTVPLTGTLPVTPTVTPAP
jgi:uncharacterized protein YoxC